MTAETKDVFESYQLAMEAWDKVPKAPFEIEVDGDMVTYRCPECGDIVAKHDYSLCDHFRLIGAVICCGKLLQ